MPQWLIYGSNDTTQRRVFVRPDDVRAVVESNDGSSILVLANSTQIAVSTPALTVMAAISDPPEPPVMVARIDPPTNPTPLLSGAAEPFATVVVRDGGTQVVVTKADATERWEANTTPLSPGNHTLIATQTDIFGLISKPSAPCSIVIEAPAPPPAPPVPEPVPVEPPPPEPSETVFAPSESREPFVVTDAPATSETPVAGTPAAEDTF